MCKKKVFWKHVLCFVFRDQINWAMMTTELEQIGVDMFGNLDNLDQLYISIWICVYCQFNTPRTTLYGTISCHI